MQKPSLLIYNANEILTLKGEAPKIKEEMKNLGIIYNSAIAIKNGKIIAIGEIKGEISKNSIKIGEEKIDLINAKKINAKKKVILPGFVDCHTHLIFSGSRENELQMKLNGRSYLDILKSGGGIYSTVKKTKNATKEHLIKEAKERAKRMLSFGTTTAEVKSGYGLNLKEEIKILEVIKELNKIQPIKLIPTFLAHAIPEEYKGREDNYTEYIANEILPIVAKRKLAEFCDVFCEKEFFNIEQSKKILKKAKNLKLTPKIHADELTDLNSAELSSELNCISTEHLLFANDKGLKKMAEKKVIAVLLPTTSFSSFLNYANARKMINLGVPIALATDLNPNCYCENMQFVISLACYKLKMTPEEAITSATINSACAINRQNKIGSLEIGKNADILILNCENYLQIPYKFGGNLVEKIVKNGKVVRTNN